MYPKCTTTFMCTRSGWVACIPWRARQKCLEFLRHAQFLHFILRPSLTPVRCTIRWVPPRTRTNGSSHSTKGNAFEETSRLLRKNHLPRIHLFFCRTATFLRLQRSEQRRARSWTRQRRGFKVRTRTRRVENSLGSPGEDHLFV